MKILGPIALAVLCALGAVNWQDPPREVLEYKCVLVRPEAWIQGDSKLDPQAHYVQRLLSQGWKYCDVVSGRGKECCLVALINDGKTGNSRDAIKIFPLASIGSSLEQEIGNGRVPLESIWSDNNHCMIVLRALDEMGGKEKDWLVLAGRTLQNKHEGGSSPILEEQTSRRLNELGSEGWRLLRELLSREKGAVLFLMTR